MPVNKLFLKEKKGISVLYVVFIASILLAIGFGISGILIRQIRMMSDIGYSVAAFYAADAGIEKVLMQRETPFIFNDFSQTLDNQASYKIIVIGGGENGCQADNFCIKSIGTYRGVKRAIEVEY